MAGLAARNVFCELNKAEKLPGGGGGGVGVDRGVVSIPAVQRVENSRKIVLQPRLCTLRSYASDEAVGVIKSSSKGSGSGSSTTAEQVSQFFVTLSDYVDSSKKSHDFEIISGRLAMIVFAGTVMTEFVTGNSLFRKMDLQGIAEAAGVGLGAVVCAAIFAWFSSNRNKVGGLFALKCNTFIDSLIDQIIDGLFYESDIGDWSDEL